MKRRFIAFLLVFMLVALSITALSEAASLRPDGETYVYGMLPNISMSQEELNEWAKGYGFIDRYVFYNDLSTMLLDLKNERIDGMTMLPEFTAQYLAARDESLYYKDFNLLTGSLLSSMATSAENQALCDMLDKAIADMEEDGTLNALRQRYLSGEAVLKDAEPEALPKTEGQTVRVVITGDIPPMDVVNASGQPAGFNVALLSAISARTGLNIELTQADSGARLAMLASGRADVIFWIGSVNLTHGQYVVNLEDVPEGLVSTRPYVSGKLVNIKVKAK